MSFSRVWLFFHSGISDTVARMIDVRPISSIITSLSRTTRVAQKAPKRKPANSAEKSLVNILGTNDITMTITETINAHSFAQLQEKKRPNKSPAIIPTPSNSGTLEI